MANAEERQVTSSLKNHMLDNNDNFSPDMRFLCYDTREGIGPGIENSQSVEKVEIATGVETVLYEAEDSITGAKAAPGIGAVSYSPTDNRVVFIHGPPLAELDARGYYAKPNRGGGTVADDGEQQLGWVDHRDIDTSRDTLPGAHRGGTHRHEYALNGKRIGFTYDDFLLRQYDRTIGYMDPHPDAPGGASHYFALLVRVPPKGTAKPGEIEHAAGDSWVGREGRMRAFIGKVRNEDATYTESLFVVDIPANVDITTADSGAADRYPSPPQGLAIRRLTHEHAEGIVRGTPDGDRIAYYAHDESGVLQVFIIASDGSDRDSGAAKRPVQATRFENGAGPGLRWHPSGNSIACIADNAIAVTCVKPGPLFGQTRYLTSKDGPDRDQLVWSPDGSMFAFDKRVPTHDADGKRGQTYDGQDFSQIFVVDFPDENGDGIMD